VEKLNKSRLGPWITKSKKTIVVKLLNLMGKSVAIEIAIPKLYDLPNLMTNFN